MDARAPPAGRRPAGCPGRRGDVGRHQPTTSTVARGPPSRGRSTRPCNADQQRLGRRRHGHELLPFKGGTGTSSRVVRPRHPPTTRSVCLLQANFGELSELRVAGVKIAWRGARRTTTRWGGVGSAATRSRGSSGRVGDRRRDVTRRCCPAVQGAGATRAAWLARTGRPAGTSAATSSLAVLDRGEQRRCAARSRWGRERRRGLRRAAVQPRGGHIDPSSPRSSSASRRSVLERPVVNQDMVGRDGTGSPAPPHDRLLDGAAPGGSACWSPV